MSESDETRIARLEATRDDHTERLRILFPLVSQYAVLEERLTTLRVDLNKGFDAIREEMKDGRKEAAEENLELRGEIKEMKTEQVSRGKERRGYLAAIVVCAIGLFGNFIAQVIAPNPVAPPAKEQTK